MAIPKLWHPGMGGLTQYQPSRLRMPVPGYKDPYTGAGLGLQSYPHSGQGSGQQIPAPQQPIPAQSQSLGTQYTPQGPRSPGPPKPNLEISPYMETIYKSIQNIDPEQRAEYLQTTASSIKDRLDRYEFRIARGIPLTPEQQRQYDSIRDAYNDIQKYINNPTPYDEVLGQQLVDSEQARLQRDPEYIRRMALHVHSQFPQNSSGTFL